MSDARGWFLETYSEVRLEALGIKDRFVQDNQSFSARAGVVRGLHFQRPPFAQAKLVRCQAGRILDVVVDLRRRSPTFGQHLAVELSAADGRQLYVPVGFGHGFATLEPGCEVAYKVSAPYDPASEAGVRWDDPDVAVDWRVSEGDVVLSEKDKSLPRLADLESPFTYDGTPMVLALA